MTMQVEPPKLRDLIARCATLGYAEPDIDIGDMAAPDGSGARIPAVQVQLHSNENGRRNVVAHCRVLNGDDPKRMTRLAVRAAFAQALDLAESPSAVAA